MIWDVEIWEEGTSPEYEDVVLGLIEVEADTERDAQRIARAKAESDGWPVDWTVAKSRLGERPDGR